MIFTAIYLHLSIIRATSALASGRDVIQQCTASAGHTPYEITIQQEIVDAFEVLDHQKKGVANFRDVSLVMRYLDCFPTEAEIQDLLAPLEKDEHEYYKVVDILPLLKRAFLENRYEPTSKDTLIEAFKVAEKENDGGLDAEHFGYFLTDLGEPMSKASINEFIDLVKDEKTGLVKYQDYTEQLFSRELYKL